MSHAAHPAHDEHGHGHQPHAVPFWLLTAVFGALMVLTVLTVAVAKVNLGEFNLPVALLIALIKASLVVLFFMHLFWDSLFNAISLLSGLAFVALFIWFSMVDVSQYLPQTTNDWKSAVATQISQPRVAVEKTPGHGEAGKPTPRQPADPSAAVAPAVTAAAPTPFDPKQAPAAPSTVPPVAAKQADEKLDPELVAKGKALFQAKICFTCHQIPGGPPAPVGPSYEKGLPWGKKRKVTAGPGGAVEEIVVDEAYFRESVKEPMKKIAINEQTNQPYPPAMVLPFPVTDEEINALMAYVKSLSK